MDGAALRSAVMSQFRGTLPTSVGVAVSGGGDSVALLYLLKECLTERGVRLAAATVDHGLRDEAAQEADFVAELCKSLGITHTTLKWEGKSSKGNLMDQARRARYRLLSEWAKSQEIKALALGHTADDQAETFIMRLGRASGVSGLAAMPVTRTLNGVTLIRPILQISRRDLRTYLDGHRIAWIEDPTNEDESFERVRVRKAMQALEPLGLTVPVLSRVAGHMNRAKEALDWYSFVAAKDVAEVIAGAVVFDIRKLRILPKEIARQLVARALVWVGRSEYTPRQSAMEDAIEAIWAMRSMTLNGCHIKFMSGRAWICREYECVRRNTSAVVSVWDGRWKMLGESAPHFEVRATGSLGLKICTDWRSFGLPRDLQMACPSVWHGDTLVSAPFAGYANGWTAELEFGSEEFFATLLTH